MASSTQAQQQESTLNDLVRPRDLGGCVRIAAFDWTRTAGDSGGDIFHLIRLKPNTLCLGGRLEWLLGGTSLDIGIKGADGSGFYDAAGTLADDTDFFTASVISTAANSEGDWGIDQADPGIRYVTDKEVWLTLNFTAAPVASQTVSGHMFYVNG